MAITNLSGLKPGDKVGVVALGEYDQTYLSTLEMGRQQLEALGYSLVVGENNHERYAYLAGTDRVRADALHKLIEDETIKAVICWGDVWGAARLIPHLDISRFQDNPKLLIGSGANTSLLLAIHKFTDLPVFHGPSLGRIFRSQATLQYFRNLLVYGSVHGEIARPLKESDGISDNQPIVSYGSRIATGPLVGGNLSAVATSLGTPYEIDTAGKLLFLEAHNDEPEFIERDLASLWLAGKLQASVGVIFGECIDCFHKTPPQNDFSTEEVIDDYLSRLGLPALYGLQIGFGQQMDILPIGLPATLDVAQKTLTAH